jgi:tRNA pseudouridine-54 N-methylase
MPRFSQETPPIDSRPTGSCTGVPSSTEFSEVRQDRSKERQRKGDMRKVIGLVMSAVVVLLAAGCDAQEQKRPQMPNILFILTDDLDDNSESIAHMENLRSLVTNRGVTLKNARHSVPLLPV